MKRSSGIKRLGYEALRRLRQPTVQDASRFSFFHGAATGMKTPQKIAT
jgi:hypothetical protein